MVIFLQNLITREFYSKILTKDSALLTERSGPRLNINRAANQYGISVFCTDFTCKIREYEFGLQNTEIELCQFCHLRYYLPEQSLPVLGSKSVKICGILCLKTFKYLFNHQNIHSSLFHM